MDDLGGIKLIQASELNSAAVRAAFGYWQSKRSGDSPPFSDALEPMEVPRLLPHLMLKDVRRDPWDFRYRVIGTTVREHSRHNRTGKWTSEVDGQARARACSASCAGSARAGGPRSSARPTSARTRNSKSAKPRSCRGATATAWSTACWSRRIS